VFLPSVEEIRTIELVSFMLIGKKCAKFHIRESPSQKEEKRDARPTLLAGQVTAEKTLVDFPRKPASIRVLLFA